MATFNPAVKSVCLETGLLVLLLILMNFISDGTCQTIKLTCTQPQEGSATKFNCSVSKLSCDHKSVVFNFESKDGTPSRLCTTSSSSTCDQNPVGGMSCGCVSSDSDYRYYQLNFLGDEATYKEGKLTCFLNCLTGEPSDFCQPLIFASPSTSPSTTTVESAVTTSQSPSATTSNSSSTETGDQDSNGNNGGNSMHVLRTGFVVSMSGIIALISTHLS